MKGRGFRSRLPRLRQRERGVYLLVAILASCGDHTVRSPGDVPEALFPDTLRMVEHERLWNVRRAALSEDRLYLLNSGSNQILVFDRDGGLESVIGGPGQGPGEFGFARDLVVRPPDSLYVLDSLLRRVSLFVGAALEEDWSLRGAPTGGYPERMVVADGLFLIAFRGAGAASFVEPAPNARRESLRIVKMGPADREPSWETLLELPGLEVMDLRVAAGRMEVVPAFGTDLRYELIPHGIVATDRREGWVKRWEWGGGETTLLEPPQPPRYISEVELRAWREGVEERVGRPDASGEDPQIRRLSLMAGVERWDDGVPRPVFDELVASEEVVALKEYEFRGHPVPAWSFLDGEGTFLGRWIPEKDVRVLALHGDRIVSVVRDSLDVESILISRLPGR